MADAGDGTLEAKRRLVEDLAGLVEDGEAARAAFIVAFVGDDEAVVVQPLHGVGLAHGRPCFAGELQLRRRVLVSMPSRSTRAGGEVRLHRAGLAVDDDDLVVFLQGQGDLVLVC